jgi:hypothetical protein
MSPGFKEVASQALELPDRERVRLAQMLTTSLEPECETVADVEAVWMEEAQRRLNELRDGAVVGIDAADAFAMARKNLKQ